MQRGRLWQKASARFCLLRPLDNPLIFLAPPAGLEPATHGLGNCSAAREDAPGDPRGRPAWQSLAKRVPTGPPRSYRRSHGRLPRGVAGWDATRTAVATRSGYAGWVAGRGAPEPGESPDPPLRRARACLPPWQGWPRPAGIGSQPTKPMRSKPVDLDSPGGQNGLRPNRWTSR